MSVSDITNIFLTNPHNIYYIAAVICLVLMGLTIHQRKWLAFSGWLSAFALVSDILFQIH